MDCAGDLKSYGRRRRSAVNLTDDYDGYFRDSRSHDPVQNHQKGRSIKIIFSFNGYRKSCNKNFSAS